MAADPQVISQNLRSLCDQYPSISEVCRQIGINRQQFNKYLSGTYAPSRGNLAQICEFFKIDPDTIQLPPARFERLVKRRNEFDLRMLTGYGRLTISEAQDREIQKNLERYCGLYHCYYLSPVVKKTVRRGLVSIYQEAGETLSKYMERNRHPPERSRAADVYRMSGMVSMHGDKLYQIDYRIGSVNSFSMTILYESARDPIELLTGIVLGVYDQGQNTIFATRCLYVALGDDYTVKEALKMCGGFPDDDPSIPPGVAQMVRNRLAVGTGVMTGDMGI